MTVFNIIIDLAQQSLGFTLVVVAFLSLCVGSFLNVVIYRTPIIMNQEWRKESGEFWQTQADLDDTHKSALLTAVQSDTKLSLSFPPSSCPHCDHSIRFYENIPIISWLCLKGKCSGCAASISARYPLVELITALLSILVIVVLGATAQGFLALFFTWILVALTGIDFDTQLLPNRLVYPLGMMGLFANSFGLYVSPQSAILGAIVGFLCFWVVAKVYTLIKKQDGMGFGDFTLMAALGAWLGVGMLPLLIFGSAILGSLVGGILFIKNKGSKPFAFGPYIAISGFVALLWGNQIIQWYIGKLVH